jgi:hypothetical protein
MPQVGDPHPPGGATLQTGKEEFAVCAAGTLNSLSSFLLPQWGHSGFSWPRISSSNS